eukprot:6157564-Pleurochrysis_carterae.AAC.4
MGRCKHKLLSPLKLGIEPLWATRGTCLASTLGQLNFLACFLLSLRARAVNGTTCAAHVTAFSSQCAAAARAAARHATGTRNGLQET